MSGERRPTRPRPPLDAVREVAEAGVDAVAGRIVPSQPILDALTAGVDRLTGEVHDPPRLHPALVLRDLAGGLERLVGVLPDHLGDDELGSVLGVHARHDLRVPEGPAHEVVIEVHGGLPFSR